ncbi:MAG: mechanosensitive ion channel family protein [Candidatus Eisenbacteria bacterium]|nr:mechanosensitive ion channel family protein [Candidatus Eisenbacteria bacterium]
MADFLNDLMASYGRVGLKWLITSGLRVILILIGVFILSRIAFRLIRRIEILADDGDPTFQSLQEKRAATLSLLLRQLTGVVLALVSGMMILREFRVDIAPIIAGAGVIGLAVGFGAQSLVKDIISGFFILLENQFDVGDVISGAGVSGGVERIGLRFTQLRDLEGRVHFIPNGEFRVVSNLTRGWSRAVVDIGVSYSEDIDRVQDVLRDVADGLRADPAFTALMLEPMEILGVESFGDSAVTIKVIFKTLPGKQWPVAREFRKRLKARFDALGIEIPLPQRVVHTIALPSAAVPATTDLAPDARVLDGPGSVQPDPGSSRSNVSRLPDTID